MINTYNRCDSLERTLDGLKHQTYPNFEVVVVNGPSTDATAELLMDRSDAVRAGFCPERCLGASRNIGAGLAAGEIVAFTDDDAVPYEAWLERLVAAYDAGDVGAAGGPVFDVPSSRTAWRVCTCTRDGVPSSTHRDGRNSFWALAPTRSCILQDAT